MSSLSSLCVKRREMHARTLLAERGPGTTPHNVGYGSKEQKAGKHRETGSSTLQAAWWRMGGRPGDRDAGRRATWSGSILRSLVPESMSSTYCDSTGNSKWSHSSAEITRKNTWQQASAEGVPSFIARTWKPWSVDDVDVSCDQRAALQEAESCRLVDGASGARGSYPNHRQDSRPVQE